MSDIKPLASKIISAEALEKVTGGVSTSSKGWDKAIEGFKSQIKFAEIVNAGMNKAPASDTFTKIGK